MSTGENEQALRKILDFTRMGSLIILAIHFYITCYGVFLHWGWTYTVIDRIINNVAKIHLFHHDWLAKTGVLILLAISLIGAKGRKSEQIRLKPLITYIVLGLILFYGAIIMLWLSTSIVTRALLFMGVTGVGYLLMLSGGTQLSRLIKGKLQNDLFNRLAESFPQEERLLVNDSSVNLPTRYSYQGKVRNGFINIINGYRATLVMGTPGSR
ncbi:Zn-dependent protease with chaperone function [Chitinophaga terrae (ex Kim and Jung 2007)]|uniref:YWFCY domain-containing protein n=1 Tax=Chitinophaga terrae (ex Kim and Jung 2007) TaxID=408074 RepID=UPI00277F4C21|nr:YWFCY domain-containing protein [Chitinophaga terrae (ex Kim and Jung 2007)]MDQ0107450.1 Zn-dependent protease with chaperone function [Chitinophaga terrae (ex Kim and Jung 2007)]